MRPRVSFLRIGLAVFVILLLGTFGLRSLRETLQAESVGSIAPFFLRLRIFGEYIGGWATGGASGRIRALEAERARLLGLVAERDGLGRENEMLRAILSLRQDGQTGAIPAVAVGFFREGRDEFLLLNRGTEEGIGVGDVVLSKSGVFAGTVIDAGRGSSKVMLLSSSSRSIDVLISGTELRAIARGNNNRELIIELVPQDASLAAGDLVVASPRVTGGRRSLLVGEVREVQLAEHEAFKIVRATHLYDPRDEDVIVLPAP